jgi:anti-sigma regulatory factor (Ser/Thr protein kinase)
VQELLVLHADYADLKRLAVWVATLGAAAGLGDRDRFRIDLALTEAVTNIVDLAHSKGGAQEIRIRRDVLPQAIMFELTDDGPPFNILDAKSRALPARLEDSILGGSGIRLIRSYSDDIRYERVGSLNRLTLGFRVSGASQGA